MPDEPMGLCVSCVCGLYCFLLSLLWILTVLIGGGGAAYSALYIAGSCVPAQNNYTQIFQTSGWNTKTAMFLFTPRHTVQEACKIRNKQAKATRGGTVVKLQRYGINTFLHFLNISTWKQQPEQVHGNEEKALSAFFFFTPPPFPQELYTPPPPNPPP